MKKILSLITALILALSSFWVPLSAYAQTGETLKEKIIIDNPYYAGREIPSGSIDSASDASTVLTYDGVKYYSKGKTFYTAIKNKCQDRAESFRINYLSKSKLNTLLQYKALWDDLWSNATEDEIATGTTDGDYLRWQLGYVAITSAVIAHTGNGYYYYNLTLEPLYYTTKAQEKKVDGVINSFVNSVDTNSLTDYEVIKKIHDFICSKTKYDYGADNTTYYSYSAYGTLVYGKSVCQGYANAFYRICRELGYKSRIVTSDPAVGCHAWNIVQLDGKYYFVDCTWDDEIIDEPTGELTDRYTFFLTNYENSQKYDNHFEHLLEDTYYDTDYFNKNYKDKFDAENYKNTNPKLFSRSTIVLSNKRYTYDGKEKTPNVKITLANGVELENGTDFKVTYSANVNTGCASVWISGTGAYAGKCSKRLFEIKPDKAAKPKRTSVEEDLINLKWTQNGGNVSGYCVEIYNNGKWENTAYTSKPEATVAGLTPSKVYKFRVRAYKYISKRTLYGDYGNVFISSTRPDRVEKLALTTSKKRINAKWKKTAGTGYQLQYGLKKNMKDAKTVNITGAKNREKALKKLKSNKKYYVRVRAFKKYKVSGKVKTLYGMWSGKKAIKCK